VSQPDRVRLVGLVPHGGVQGDEFAALDHYMWSFT